MNTPGERLKAAREQRGYETAKDAALAMGVPVATYTMHESAVKHLPARRADEYAAFFGITPEYLLYGRGQDVRHVPVLNKYGAPAGYLTSPPPAPSDLTFALEGDGQAHFGFVALYNHPQTDRPPPYCDGRLCVVCIQANNPQGSERLIRIVRQGSSPGHFHLMPVPAQIDSPLFDQEVFWIAPVLALVPR